MKTVYLKKYFFIFTLFSKRIFLVKGERLSVTDCDDICGIAINQASSKLFSNYKLILFKFLLSIKEFNRKLIK